jgi:predicted phosphohydrolase
LVFFGDKNFVNINLERLEGNAMSLFAIADPHLSLDADKSMEVFRGWQDYVARLEANWRAVVGEEDTVVIAGDLSWGMSLAGALRDMQFLHSLPGRKLLLKGNHDYWWSTRRKMDTFFEEHGLYSLQIVHNDAALVEGIAVCGTRGWFFDAEEDADKKVVLREAGRLRTSIQAAKALGGEPVAFLHYPPVTQSARCEEMMRVLEDEGIRRCYYGHLHGPATRAAVTGEREGIRFSLISADYLSFCPKLVPAGLEGDASST